MDDRCGVADPVGARAGEQLYDGWVRPYFACGGTGSYRDQHHSGTKTRVDHVPVLMCPGCLEQKDPTQARTAHFAGLDFVAVHAQGPGQGTEKEKRHGHDTDHHFGPRADRRTACLASQQELGILSQRRTWTDLVDSAHFAAPWEDLKRF